MTALAERAAAFADEMTRRARRQLGTPLDER